MNELTILVNKVGPGGRPAATLIVDPKLSSDELTGLIQKNLTRNKDLLKKLGLKSCLACTSGMDINIRQRFDFEMRVQY